MKPSYILSPPLDFRFLDLLLILLLSASAIVIIVVAMGVGASSWMSLHISTSILAHADQGIAYNQELIASGGRGHYVWSVEGLPRGLDMTPAGIITGIPGAHGQFTVKVIVRDGSRASAQKTLLLTVLDVGRISPLQILTETLPTAQVGRSYDYVMAVQGGLLPYRWTISGIPRGLVVTNGKIKGEPDSPGIFPVGVLVQDASGQQARRELYMQVVQGSLGDRAKEPARLTVSTLVPKAVSGISYTVQLAASGGVPPYQWQLLSPDSDSQLSENGTLSIENPPTTSDSMQLHVRVFDAEGTHSDTLLTIKILHLPRQWTKVALAIAAVGTWVILLFLLRTGARLEGTAPWAVSEHRYIGFVSVLYFAAALIVGFNSYAGTLLMVFLTGTVAVYALLRYA